MARLSAILGAGGGGSSPVTGGVGFADPSSMYGVSSNTGARKAIYNTGNWLLNKFYTGVGYQAVTPATSDGALTGLYSLSGKGEIQFACVVIKSATSTSQTYRAAFSIDGVQLIDTGLNTIPAQGRALVPLIGFPHMDYAGGNFLGFSFSPTEFTSGFELRTGRSNPYIYPYLVLKVITR